MSTSRQTRGQARVFWRTLRLLWRGRSRAIGTRREPLSLNGTTAATAADVLVDALLRLRATLDETRFTELPLAWFRVDEAKASAVWYNVAQPPAHPAVLPEEQALAERTWQTLTGHAVSPRALLADAGIPADNLALMLRYRLLVAALPSWCARGGRRAAEAIKVAYALMERSPEVLSPYGRWLLAREVCLATHDHEELARQTERFRVITADHRAEDGASMAFISGGEYELPLPVSLSEILDSHGLPTRTEAIKADPDARRLFLRLTKRSQELFLRAFRRREEAYRNGYPWRRPAWVASEGYVFVRTPVHLPAFFIDRRPVTNAMFEAFVHAHPLWRPSRVSVHAVTPDTYLPGWVADRPSRGTAAEPVTNVSYQACRAYVAAYRKQLPTEAEWVYALVGPQVPETRYVGADSRPTMSEDERTIYGRRAAQLGLHLWLPERVHDFDDTHLARVLTGHPLTNPDGRGGTRAHVWRTPTAHGRVPDLAGDANLTFRGVLPATQLWTGGDGR